MSWLIFLLMFFETIWLIVLSVIFVKKLLVKPKQLPSVTTGLRFSLIRFNPFSDTGGEQSFVLSLLDPGGSGILLTSLHGRGITRLYAKRVVAGKVDLELSAEEKQALSQALHEKPISYE